MRRLRLLTITGAFAVLLVTPSAAQAKKSVCATAFPSAASTTIGDSTYYNRQQSVKMVACDGFGAPDNQSFRMTNGLRCTLVSAAIDIASTKARGAKVVLERTALGVDGACSGVELANEPKVVTGIGIICGWAADLLGVAAKSTALGIISNAGCAAAPIVGSGFGHWLETNHEEHIASDVLQKGKCIKLRRRLGLWWSAPSCRAGDKGFSNLPKAPNKPPVIILPPPTGNGDSGDDQQSQTPDSPTPTAGPPSSVSVSNSNGQMVVQVVNFPTGQTPYFCHAGGPAEYPTGGTVTGRGQVNITSANQSWASGLCSGGHNTNMWIGFQGTDGHDYYSNQVVIDVAARPGASVSVSNSNGQMVVQVVNFPTGQTPYFCHAGGPAEYPTGGTVTGRGQVNITSANQSWASGLCSGGHNTNMWIGFQGTDGHDYYSNQVVIDVAATPGASALVFGSNGQMSLQLSGFPTGTNYYFCHQGDPSQYPYGGAIIGHAALNVTTPNGSYGPLCSGSGPAWIGVQGADGHDYYSNVIQL